MLTDFVGHYTTGKDVLKQMMTFMTYILTYIQVCRVIFTA